MTTEPTTQRLNARDLRRALAWAWDHCLFPLDGGRGESDRTVAWDDLCAACGLTGPEMARAIDREIRIGKQSITRELRAQRGGS